MTIGEGLSIFGGEQGGSWAGESGLEIGLEGLLASFVNEVISYGLKRFILWCRLHLARRLENQT